MWCRRSIAFARSAFDPHAIDHTPSASQRAKAAADLMRNWDGTMATDLAPPTIAYYSRAVLAELLLKAKLGDDWKTYHWFMKPVWLENILINQPQRWLPAQYASYDTLLAAAVEAALTQEHAPTALSSWRWGTGAHGACHPSLLEQHTRAQARGPGGAAALRRRADDQAGAHPFRSVRSASPLICRTSITPRSIS